MATILLQGSVLLHFCVCHIYAKHSVIEVTQPSDEYIVYTIFLEAVRTLTSECGGLNILLCCWPAHFY